MKIAALLVGAALLLPAQVNYRRAPGFALMDPIQQKWFDLADFRGKVVLVELMQTTCPKCQELSGLLEEVKTKYGDKIQVLSVVTLPDTLKTVQTFISEHKVTSPVLFDCGQMIGSYMQVGPKNPSVHFPALFVIDKNGMIRRQLGDTEMTAANVLGALEGALK
jgi:peroxiredoxin